MRNLILAATVLTLASACASNPKIPRPEIGIVELRGPSSMGNPSGMIEVQFEIQVKNIAGDPITLRQVDIQSVGDGAYVLRREVQIFNLTIPPGQVGTATFWVRALARGNTLSQDEPVSVHGVAKFDSAQGPFQQFFRRDITQFGSGPH
jgi:hypothetical protein